MLNKYFQHQGYDVMLEPTLSHNGSVLKPDLVLCRGNSHTIIDVTVRFEDVGTIDRAVAEKEQKYKPLYNYFKPSEVLSIFDGDIRIPRGIVSAYKKVLFAL